MNNICSIIPPMLTILPRILAILYIAFISLFALDVFEEGYGFWGTMLALLMHLIPSFILVACLVVAWKRPRIGGALFLALAIIFTLFFKTYRSLVNFSIVSLPLLIIGGLFVLSRKKSGKATMGK